MTRTDIVNTILARLRSVCQMKGIAETKAFNESTILIGSETAVLDSLGIVMLLVQIEESIDSLRGSPTALVQRLFAEDVRAETVGSLADRCVAMIGDGK